MVTRQPLLLSLCVRVIILTVSQNYNYALSSEWKTQALTRQ